MRETMADLAMTGRLDGRRVRILEKVLALEAGSVGTVQSVSRDRKAVVHYVRATHERDPWREMTVESPFWALELVPA